MPYQNDLSTLADIVSPVDAAMQAGQQGGYQNLQSAAENAVRQATVPAAEQEPYLKNLFMAAQTAGQRGIAQQEQAKGTVAGAMVPSQIGAGTAENQTKITGAHVEQLQNMAQVVGGLADQLEQRHPLERPGIMQQTLDSFGVTDPSIRQLVDNGDPDTLRRVSQGLFQASEKARQTSMAENIRGGYQLGTAQIGASGRLQAAEAQAQARVQVGQLMAQVRQQQQTFEQAAVQAQKQGNPQLANQYAQAALQMRQAQAQLNSQLLFNNQMQTPIGTAAPAGGEAPTAPQGATPAANTPEDAVTAEMRKRGLLQ